ncbi:DUF2917 domain-containing protein [Roseateles koreensis]|uniref:DUF2917 domain-containing protein n=1 Tax=Roseateles koreensis TaxID=2987526 RepID=A0ABT5KNX4_9BURK|nr:DUF2917 domain-containing protein [Roseateles koreensis]MDC8784619.1 DUF2917 domain-containing protein [Roseateles koreensis]
MTNSQQGLWHLGAGEALGLDIGPGERTLVLSTGRLWLTLTQPASAHWSSALPEDVWLEAGQSLHLAHGAQVVVEAWPKATFQLLVPPCPRRVGAPRWARFKAQLAAQIAELDSSRRLGF